MTFNSDKYDVEKY